MERKAEGVECGFERVSDARGSRVLSGSAGEDDGIGEAVNGSSRVRFGERAGEGMGDPPSVVVARCGCCLRGVVRF